ncbi:MAG: hypothetical protein ACI9JN_001364 [Bacteroidia bacterium]|jgi:uncharacterized protein (DUF1684 family)
MRFLIFLVMSVIAVCQSFGQSAYINSIHNDREYTDSLYSDSSVSILPYDQVAAFNGLPYYEVDSAFKVTARLQLKKGKPFEMQTSTKRLPVYRKYGKLSFQIGETKCELFLYQQVVSLTNDTVTSEYLFCPFRDLSNQDSTYGGGRYLDFKLSDVRDMEVVIDFNLCYNPYCAYNSRYSCPVPPLENKLKIRIDAGVKKWHEH